LPMDGFYSANKNIFYRDLGVVEEKRYVVSFNVQIYHVESADREKRIREASIAVSELNYIFAHRKKTLEYDDAEKQLKDILDKYSVNKFFSYTLIPTVLNKETESYRMEIKLLDDRVNEAGQTDGMMVYITDHTEKQDDQIRFKLSAFDIICHYKNKYVIENAFREMKSFVDLRPFHVWTEDHVKAHFDVGVIAYFINNYIYERLSDSRRNFEQFLNLIKDQFSSDVEQVKEYSRANKLSLKEINDCDKIANFISKISQEQKLSNNFLTVIDDYGQPASIRKFYEAVNDNANVVKLLSPQKTEIYKMKPLGPQIKGLLSRLDMTSLVLPSTHTSTRIYQ